MAFTEYGAPVQHGLIPYTNTGSALSAGDCVSLVTGSSGGIAIAKGDIAATTGTGTLQTLGPVTGPKATGEALTVWQTVYWDGTQLTGTSSTTFSRAGRVVLPAASAATTVTILLNQS